MFGRYSSICQRRIGCSTGSSFEGGHDHTFYQFRQNPINYGYSRTIIQKFQHTQYILNFCEDSYSIPGLQAAYPETYLVHSKGPYLNPSLMLVRKEYQSVMNRYTDYRRENAIADKLNSGALSHLQVIVAFLSNPS